MLIGKNRQLRIAENLKTGELFIECPRFLWSKALNKWRQNHNIFLCPMPLDHTMFDKTNDSYEHRQISIGLFKWALNN